MRTHAYFVVLALIVGSVALAGCKSPRADVAAVNALVAEKHKYKLTFAERELVSGVKRPVTYFVPLPTTWNVDGTGNVTPRDTEGNGNSSVHVGSSCDLDECKFEDLIQVVDARVAWERDLGVTFTRDEMIDGRRVLVNPAGLQRDGVQIRVFWPANGGPGYHTCIASLDVHLVDSALAFVKACQMAQVR